DDALEPVRLGVGPHRHETAIAAADQPEPAFVHGGDFFNRVDPGKDVLEIAATEVALVGCGERLALAEAAAWIGVEDIVARPNQIGGYPAFRDIFGRGRP